MAGRSGWKPDAPRRSQLRQPPGDHRHVAQDHQWNVLLQVRVMVHDHETGVEADPEWQAPGPGQFEDLHGGAGALLGVVLVDHRVTQAAEQVVAGVGHHTRFELA